MKKFTNYYLSTIARQLIKPKIILTIDFNFGVFFPNFNIRIQLLVKSRLKIKNLKIFKIVLATSSPIENLMWGKLISAVTLLCLFQL